MFCAIKGNMNKLKWELLKKTEKRCGYYTISNRKYKLPNDKTVYFDVRIEPSCVCILPISEKNTIILTKQFRPGLNKILIELPGGYIEKNEKPLQAAKRELIEETGYSGKLKYVGMTYEHGACTCIRYNYVALGCRKASKQNLDSSEFIQIIEMNMRQFRLFLQNGKTTDIQTGYLGLDYLKLL